MDKWVMIIDVAECTNCQLCTLATMDEYLGNEWPGYSAPMPRHGHRWINIVQKERGSFPNVDVAYVPTLCNHCDNAPCIEAASNNAVVKRPDGIVLIDPAKAKGQRHLIDACPYGHIWWNERLEVPQTWNFDAHLIDGGWTETRGSQACPTGAMKTVKVSDNALREVIDEQKLEVLNPELDTRPRVYYKNLDRFTKCFIAGTLTTTLQGRVECLEGASVALEKEAEVIGEATSDFFGDFKFDALEPLSGTYTLVIEAAGFERRVVETCLGESIHLGEILLRT